MLDHAARWAEVMPVVDWFAAHPRPGLYLRQLDIPGVDTKFIETHRALLSELLDLVLPAAEVDRAAVGARAFNVRYGLRDERPLVRFRLLDPALYLQGLSDLSLPPEQFADLRLPLRRVFITENRTTGLAFPDCPGGMVVFGLGYGLERLTHFSGTAAKWVRERMWNHGTPARGASELQKLVNSVAAKVRAQGAGAGEAVLDAFDHDVLFDEHTGDAAFRFGYASLALPVQAAVRDLSIEFYTLLGHGFSADALGGLASSTCGGSRMRSGRRTRPFGSAPAATARSRM